MGSTMLNEGEYEEEEVFTATLITTKVNEFIQAKI